MNEGRIVACGPADDVMGLPADEWTAAFLGVEPPRSRRRGRASTDGLVEVDVRRRRRRRRLGDVAAGRRRCSFAVRPEDVMLFEAGAELPAHLGAQPAVDADGRRRRAARRDATTSCSTPDGVRLAVVGVARVGRRARARAGRARPRGLQGDRGALAACGAMPPRVRRASTREPQARRHARRRSEGR